MVRHIPAHGLHGQRLQASYVKRYAAACCPAGPHTADLD
jgi:hypothetical protein